MSARLRVLVVAYYFPPLGGGGVLRTLRVVRELASRGHRVVVLSVDDAAWMHDHSLVSEVPSGAVVRRLPNPDWGRVAKRAGGVPAPGRGRGRLVHWLVPDLALGWSALAAWACAGYAIARAVDLVYTSAPPYSAHLAGLVAQRFGLPWAADFRDGWTCDHSRLWVRGARRRLEAALEASVLQRADRLFFASEAVEARYLARSPALAARCETIPTGFEPDEFEPIAPHRRATRRSTRLELVHAGTVAINRAQTTQKLLAALAAWAKLDPAVAERVRVRWIGAEPVLERWIHERGLGGWVQREPPLGRRSLLQRLRDAQVALVLGADGPRGGEPLPGKLFDAIGAGCPVLAVAPPGALTRWVQSLGLGAVADPRDAGALLAALRGLESRWRRGRLSAPPAEARRRLAAPETVGRLVDRLEEVARRRTEARR